MTEFDRAGHWRTLSDGTRTWVSAHGVRRDGGATKPYADIDVQRLAERTPAAKNDRKMTASERLEAERERMEAIKRVIRKAPRKRKELKKLF